MRGSEGARNESFARQLSIFIPHGATKLTDHELNGDGLVQWAVIVELARRGHRLTVVAPAVSVVGEIPENVEIYVVPGGDEMSLPRYVAYSFNLYRRLKTSRKFHLVHQMNPVVRGVTIPWAFSGLPIVLGTYVGDWPYESPRYRMRLASPATWLMMATKLGLDAVQQIFAHRLLLATPFARNRLPIPWLVENRVTEIPHGIDTRRYSSTRSQDDPEPRECSVLYVGLVMPHKGIGVLLEAFDMVHRILPNAKLVVVGTGPMETTIVRYAERAGWSSQLELVGSVDHDRIAGWLRSCTLVCSTALGEPFGQTILEALSCGRPIIVNDSGGPRYIVAGTGNPVVPMGDAAALAQAIVKLLSDRELCKRLGLENRLVAERRFAWSRVVDQLEEAYREVLWSSKATAK
jgi:glycosyltransferase involved in cell wall biosynthesis